MESDPPAAASPQMSGFPASLLRAAEHLTAKFQELRWFISVSPATIEGRICLVLHITDRGLPRGMVLPTSFETFKVVIDKISHLKPVISPRHGTTTPLW